MGKPLSVLAERVGGVVHGQADPEVLLLTEDSRRVRPGALFAALPGTRQDGHDFVPQALAAGAVAVLGGRSDFVPGGGIPYLRVSQPRRAAGIIAHVLAGEPGQGMRVVGITGTNGKTSTACLTRTLLESAGHPTAQFGTLGYFVGGETLDAPHTTPFAEDLAALFARARAAGMTHVVMEASSHAIEQDRIAGIPFAVAAFTNLTQDHLDYHGSMEQYLASKCKLFSELDPVSGHGVINADDPYASAFLAACRAPVTTYGDGGMVRAVAPAVDGEWTRFTLATPWGTGPARTRLLGRHNLYNALCAAAIGGVLGLEFEKICGGLEAIARVPGRFERVDAGQPFLVVVDYAHTDDGLRNVLEAARLLEPRRLITVFGCGGDRDRGKRPKMGAVAARLSDFCIVTSDNPRTEEPARILADIIPGLVLEGKIEGEDYEVIENREAAIRRALAMAAPGDLVLIAGKGHEDYQIIGNSRIHFDDREVARAVLEGR